jgi:hypothetical protein
LGWTRRDVRCTGRCYGRAFVLKGCVSERERRETEQPTLTRNVNMIVMFPQHCPFLHKLLNLSSPASREMENTTQHNTAGGPIRYTRVAYVEREVYVRACMALRSWLQDVNVRYAETGCYCICINVVACRLMRIRYWLHT